MRAARYHTEPPCLIRGGRRQQLGPRCRSLLLPTVRETDKGGARWIFRGCSLPFPFPSTRSSVIPQSGPSGSPHTHREGNGRDPRPPPGSTGPRGSPAPGRALPAPPGPGRLREPPGASPPVPPGLPHPGTPPRPRPRPGLNPPGAEGPRGAACGGAAAARPSLTARLHRGASPGIERRRRRRPERF